VSLGLLFFRFRSFAFYQIPMCFGAYVDGVSIMRFVLCGTLWFLIHTRIRLNVK